MKKLIVANWKLNPTTQKEAKEIFDAIREGSRGLNAEVVVCPPSVYLYASGFGEGIISMGAQNVYFEEKGAFTGEVSPEMLKDLGVQYVIIGHSERRKIFGETDEVINKKIKKSLETGLRVIFCIGETAEERDSGNKNKILEDQIKKGLEEINNLENVSIAYEPVWAIGTGNNCGVDEAKEAIEFIREKSGVARILYGGSVKSKNSGEYIKVAGADGLLVGGASLKPEEFIKIIKSAE